MIKADMIPIELTADSIEHLGSDFYHMPSVKSIFSVDFTLALQENHPFAYSDRRSTSSVVRCRERVYSPQAKFPLQRNSALASLAFMAVGAWLASQDKPVFSSKKLLKGRKSKKYFCAKRQK